MTGVGTRLAALAPGLQVRDRVPAHNEENVMDELIQKVQQRAGIDDSQASAAVNTVIDFLKERLPEPIADQVESALSDDANVASMFQR